MDVKDLRYFVAVYEGRSFSGAAPRLGTVQSNVSARISALEKHLRIRLFERLPQAAKPTPKARELYRGARRIIAALDDFERHARGGGRKAKTKRRQAQR
jgi:DNA-binding transcriptional LysR family regulator